MLKIMKHGQYFVFILLKFRVYIETAIRICISATSGSIESDEGIIGGHAAAIWQNALKKKTVIENHGYAWRQLF